MPDITMCHGKGCPLRESCYRFKVAPHPYRQSYFMTAPYEADRKECLFYWKEKPKAKTVKP